MKARRDRPAQKTKPKRPGRADSAFVALLYHTVLSPDSPMLILSQQEAEYATSMCTFAQSMDLLGENGYATMTSPELEEESDSAEPGGPFVVLTFDDGWRTDVEVVLPLLLERKLRGIFFVPSGLMGGRGRLTWDEVAALHLAGMEIGSHGASHRRLTELPGPVLTEELVGSRLQIEDEIGAPVAALSVPEGFYDERVIEHAWAAGYGAVFTSDWGLNVRGRGQSLFRRCALLRQHTVDDVRSLLNADALYRLPREALFRAKSALQRRLKPQHYDRVLRGALALPRWMGLRRTHVDSPSKPSKKNRP